MPKLPRVSGADAVRALERLGFTKVRQSGSHVIMRRESKGCVVLSARAASQVRKAADRCAEYCLGASGAIAKDFSATVALLAQHGIEPALRPAYALTR